MFPTPEILLGMEPEELAGFLLEYLNELPARTQYLHLPNLTMASGPLAAYAGARFQEISEAVAEAWAWLEREGMIAPRPGATPMGWVFVTRRGRRFKAHGDLEAYRKAGLLPDEMLDGQLAAKVVTAFRRGDYETAIFAAFKEVEVRVREIGHFSVSEIGVNLMRAAFKPDPPGPLTDTTSDRGEQVAVMETFAGAIGMFKNPPSHRKVEFEVNEAAALIHFANYLLGVVEGRRRFSSR